jgi:type I restriction enzyme S subunit
MIPRNCVVSLGQGTMLVRADETKIERGFLLKALNAPIVREQATKAAKGAAHPHVNLKDIRVFSVPVPSLPEQRRIVAELDALQAEVNALKRLQAETAAELDAMLPALLDRAFKGEL